MLQKVSRRFIVAILIVVSDVLITYQQFTNIQLCKKYIYQDGNQAGSRFLKIPIICPEIIRYDPFSCFVTCFVIKYGTQCASPTAKSKD